MGLDELWIVAVIVGVVVGVQWWLRKRRRGSEAPTSSLAQEESAGIASLLRPLGGPGKEWLSAVEVSGVSKSFNGAKVVDDVTFTIAAGEIFGMVGPNGAGKTTTIRMLMDIVKPDSGSIRLFGEPLTEEAKNRIGYLPEERGLYRKLTVIESLRYLAELKGMEAATSRQRALALLRHVNMDAHKDKKTEELSRGMGQIVQVIGTILHDPELVVLDEPFSGLDPVNVNLLKQILLELKAQGRAIILSSHQMNEVEALCDRVLMINRGRVALYGELAEVKARFRNNSIFVQANRLPETLPGVASRRDHGTHVELFLEGDMSPQSLLGSLLAEGIAVERFEISTPSLSEIFVRVVKDTQ